MRKPLVAANWKMMMTQKEAILFLKEPVWKRLPNDVEVSIHAPVVNLWVLREMIQRWGMVIGAQDCHWELRGPFTGETSLLSLKEIGVQLVILGHSERRRYFAETDERVNAKLKRVLEEGMRAIVCLGETLEEREAGKVFEVLSRQWEGCFKGVDASQADRVAVAYEPVWAIGTGQNADEFSVREAAGFLRERAANQWGQNASQTLLLYGGSVTTESARSYARLPEINGALVGTASTQPNTFFQIVCAFSKSFETAQG